MSCSRFPYGRFNFNSNNKKLYPQKSGCQKNIWILKSQNTIVFGLGTVVQQTIDEKTSFGEVIVAGSDNITFISDIGVKFIKANIQLAATIVTSVVSLTVSIQNFKYSQPLVLTENDDIGRYNAGGKKYVATGVSGQTVLSIGCNKWVVPENTIYRDIERIPEKGNVFPNTHKMTKAQVYALLGRGRYNR